MPRGGHRRAVASSSLIISSKTAIACSYRGIASLSLPSRHRRSACTPSAFIPAWSNGCCSGDADGPGGGGTAGAVEVGAAGVGEEESLRLEGTVCALVASRCASTARRLARRWRGMEAERRRHLPGDGGGQPGFCVVRVSMFVRFTSYDKKKVLSLRPLGSVASTLRPNGPPRPTAQAGVLGPPNHHTSPNNISRVREELPPELAARPHTTPPSLSVEMTLVAAAVTAALAYSCTARPAALAPSHATVVPRCRALSMEVADADDAKEALKCDVRMLCQIRDRA